MNLFGHWRCSLFGRTLLLGDFVHAELVLSAGNVGWPDMCAQFCSPVRWFRLPRVVLLVRQRQIITRFCNHGEPRVDVPYRCSVLGVANRWRFLLIVPLLSFVCVRVLFSLSVSPATPSRLTSKTSPTHSVRFCFYAAASLSIPPRLCAVFALPVCARSSGMAAGLSFLSPLSRLCA